MSSAIDTSARLCGSGTAIVFGGESVGDMTP